jgi:hypothetical protein
LTGLDIKLECITELLESNTHLVKSRAIHRADVLDGGTKVSASPAHSRVDGPEPRASCSGVSPPPTLLFSPSKILGSAHETLNKPFQFGRRESYCQTFAGGFSELLHQRTHTCQSRRRVSTVSTEVSNQEPQNVQLSNPAKSSGEASDAPLKLALSVDLGWKERYYLPQSPGGNTRLVHGLWPVVDQTDIGSKCFNAFRKDFVQAAPYHHGSDCNKEVTRLRSGGSPLSATR